MPEIYSKTLTVTEEHLDQQHHVNNVTYVEWVQGIAGEHWLSKFDEPDLDRDFWVVLEHHVQYKRQAFLGDVLHIETEVEPPKGVRFPRNVRIMRGEELIVSARTVWCWVDPKSQRPRRVTPEVMEMFGL